MFTFNGSKFNSKKFVDSIMGDVTSMAKEEIAERFRSIRHPETGEFPTVVIYGDDLSDMSMKVEGTQELIEHITNKIQPDDLTGVDFVEVEKLVTPKVFLSFGWEDKTIAEQVAHKLMASGIDTWWAEWEISSGDSLRQRIDEGLEGCTHFVVLLSPTALTKPWVNQEIDAGLVRMLDDKCKLIPLRYNLNYKKLPPLLSGRFSPEVTDEINIAQLINDIHGISSKPVLGKSPKTKELPDTGYSKAATAIAMFLVKNSNTGQAMEPQTSIENLVQETGLTGDDIEDAVYELRNFVKGDFGQVYPADELFVEFDKSFMEWNPEQDALRIAADLLNAYKGSGGVKEIAENYEWSPRRMNPAVSFLVSRGICRDSQTMGCYPWIQPWLHEKEDGSIRRFVKSRT